MTLEEVEYRSKLSLGRPGLHAVEVGSPDALEVGLRRDDLEGRRWGEDGIDPEKEVRNCCRVRIESPPVTEGDPSVVLPVKGGLVGTVCSI